MRLATTLKEHHIQWNRAFAQGRANRRAEVSIRPITISSHIHPIKSRLSVNSEIWKSGNIRIDGASAFQNLVCGKLDADIELKLGTISTQ